MRPTRDTVPGAVVALCAFAILALSACEGGRKETIQVGYRGLAQELNYDKSELTALAAANVAPASLAPATPSIPGVYQNVQVLTGLDANEFSRTMLAMTQWVSPKQGCAYCHVANFASDSLYSKRVARQMLAMTRDINANYRSHVAQTGVTCYSCHRGQPVPPAGIWYYTDENQYLRYLVDRPDIRIQSYTAGATSANYSSIKQTENVYAMMTVMSRAMGVNCTYCHNSRSWATWQNAPPTRITALYGARMTRYLNTNYLAPLREIFPNYRLGSHGDVPKLQCITCHQGVYKPLFGAQMAKDYPALWGFAGSWTDAQPGDTARAGYVDLRNADSISADGAPLLPPVIPRSYPAPKPAPGVTSPMSTAGQP